MIRVRLANNDIRNFLINNIPNIATDLDNDGFPDVADNCAPQQRCPTNFAACSNPDQGDLDNDNVGDACDNCDPRDSALCPTPESCANPQQNNVDQDKYGDICDPFPGCATNDLLTCAGCGISEEKAFCNFATSGAGTCNNLTRYTDSCFVGTCPAAGPTQTCLLDGSSGRCLLPADSDDDGLTNACDRCPGFKNSNPDQPNNNFHAETAEASIAPVGEVFPLPDVCDPAPIAALDSDATQAVQTFNSSGSGLPVFPSDNQLEQQRRSWQFRTTTSLGRLLDTDPARSFAGTQMFHGCQCDESSSQDCVSIQGTCRTLDPDTSLNWKKITVRDNLGTPLGAAATAPAQFSNQPNPNAFSAWTWDWWQDRLNNTFAGPLLTSSEGPDQKFPYMHGAIFVQSDANPSELVTGRLREDGHNLRRTYIELDVGRVVEAYQNVLPPAVIGEPCKFGPSCVSWFNWRKEIFSNPLALPDDFMAISFPENGQMYGIANGVKVRIPDLEDLAQLLNSPGSNTFAPVVESPRRRRANGDYREFALLPGEFSRQGATPRMVRLSSKGLILEGRRGGTAPFSALEEEAPEVVAQQGEIPVTNYRALFSTTLESVFVAGGRNGARQNTHIWRYDLQQRDWKLAVNEASPAPTGDVASMALDVSRQWLYVLFLSDQRWWHLVRYDLKNDTAKNLVTWPDLKVFRGRYLNVLEDGTLVLTGSREHSHQSFAFEVSENKFKWLGVRAGAQAVPFPPQLGSEGLVVPLLDNKDRLTYQTMQRTSFKPGMPCGAL